MDDEVVVQVEAPVYVKGEGALELSFFTYPLTLRLPVLAATRQCSRRYSDFDALRSQLCACYWACIVPPLPEKESALDQLSRRTPIGKVESDLLEYRRHGLRRFLRAVAQHAVLSQSTLLVKFVDDAQWRQCLREPLRPPRYVTPSLTDGLAKSWMMGSTVTREIAGAAYTRVLASSRGDAAATVASAHDDGSTATSTNNNNNNSNAGVSVLSDAATWEAARAFVSTLEAELRRLRERLQTLVQRRRATGAALADFGDAFAAIADASSSSGGSAVGDDVSFSPSPSIAAASTSATAVTGTADGDSGRSSGGAGRRSSASGGNYHGSSNHHNNSSISSSGSYDDAGMRQAALALQQRSHALCDAYADQAEQELMRVVCTLGYYAGTCAAVQETLRHVQTAAHYPDTLARRAHELEVALSKGGSASMTVDEVRAEMAAVHEQQQRLASELQTAEASFADEFTAFHRDGVAAMHMALRSYSNLAVAFADRLESEWSLLKTTIDELTMS